MIYLPCYKNSSMSLLIVLLIAGCGGGGSDNPAPTLTTLNTFTPPAQDTTNTQSSSTIQTTLPTQNATGTEQASPIYTPAARPFNTKNLQACTPKETAATSADSNPIVGDGIDQVKLDFSKDTTSIYGQKRWTAKAKDGRVYVLGDNTDGMIGLGAGASANIQSPTPLAINRPVELLASDSRAIDIDGNVWFWKTHPGTDKAVLAPTKLLGTPPIKKIATNTGSSLLMLARDGTVWTMSSSGFLNPNQIINVTGGQPTQVTGLTNIVDLNGGRTSLALNATGTLFSWGGGGIGSMIGRTIQSVFDAATPAAIPNLPPIKAIYVKNYASTTIFAVAFTGAVYTWGFAYPGAALETQLVNLKNDEQNDFGINATTNRISLPMLHPTLLNIASINQTNSYASGITKDGNIFVWGAQNGARFFAYDPATLIGVKANASQVTLVGQVDEFKFIAFNQQIWLKDGKLGVINASGLTTLELDACTPTTTRLFKTITPSDNGSLAITSAGEVWEIAFDTNPNRGNGLLYFISLKRVL
jgi:alpha-tubulin suppressor-like RCC1 family protein